MCAKIYGIEELDHALPLVRSIVADIMRCHRELREALARAGINEPPAQADEASLLRLLSWDTRDLLDEVRDYVRELAELGIFVRDPGAGLVEAYGDHAGDIVYYTWKFGEDRVRFFHGVFGSPRERRPVCAPA
jgi:hypothetical protein